MAHQARKRFGQNFLVDQAVIQHIVNVVNPQEKDHIIEIGPGKGAITCLILDRTKKMQAIELDRDLVPILAQKCASIGALEIIQADALQVDIGHLNSAKTRIIGNLPYNISTPLLFHLLDQSQYIVDMHFMLQKEVVDRMVAEPGSKKWGRLSVMLQAKAAINVLFAVPPQAFKPVPKVNSAIVRLKPFENPLVSKQDWGAFAKIVRAAFSQRRKTIRNTLKDFFDDQMLMSVGIKPSDRAERISLPQFIKLVAMYQSLNIK